MGQPHITYKELLEISSWGVFAMNYKKTSICDEKYKKIKAEAVKNIIHGAYCRGLYSGSPGRDIYLMFPYLTEEQTEELADMVVSKFPTSDPGNHVNVSVFVRYLYGQNEKNGIFHSKAYFKERQNQDVDLSLPRKFVRLLFDRFDESGNFYGLSVLYEMSAHRLGDEAVLHQDLNKLGEMEESYRKSVKYALKCNSYKQMFTPYYWAFEYFRKFGDREKALSYAYQMIEKASKYCPDRRDGYRRKVGQCLKYIKQSDKNKWISYRKKCQNPANSKCVRYMVKKGK